MAADATVTMRYNADTTSANSSMNSFGSTIKKVGTIMAAVFSVKAIYEIGSAFEKSFAKAGTLIDKTTTNMTALRKNVLELSNATGVAATEINEGLYQALSAGVEITGDGSDALAFMTQNLKLATGGFTDTATAVDTTTTILNAYGLEQEKVNDVSDMLIATQNEGKTTVAELGNSLSQVIPIAASLGVEYDQVGASLATLTANGDSTSEASTKMKAMFNELSKSTTATAKTFERVAGKSFPDFIKSGGTISDALALMQGHADDAGVGITELFSSIEAGNAAATITSKSGMAKFDQSLTAIRNSAGETDKAFKEMTNTAEYKMETAFNKLKNAGIQAFGALSPIITFVAGALTAVAAALSFVIDGFTGANTIATIVVGVMVALAAVYAAYLIILNAHIISTTLYIALLKVTSAVMGIVSVAATVMGVSMTAALGIIGAIIAVIAALIAVAIKFGKNPMAAEAKRIKKELKEMREEVDEGQKGIDSEAAASEKLANELINLSKKTNKTAGDIAAMRTKADILNTTLGEGTVEVDANTGALILNGKEVSKNGDEILDLIAAREKEAEATALQEAASNAYTLQMEAEKNLRQVESEGMKNHWRVLRQAKEAYAEASEGVEYYNDQLEALALTQQKETEEAAKLEAEMAANMTEEQKRQAIRDQINADRELSTEEHYAALKEMMASNYAEMGLTEEEYITQMADHQQAIYDANVAHQEAMKDAERTYLDEMFSLNDESLYDEAKTVEEQNAIFEQHRKDRAKYHSNLIRLSAMGLDGLAQVYEDGGVAIGGSMQETMDDLQGIGIDGWKLIKADWDANGGHLSDSMKEKFGDIDVEAGLGVLALEKTTVGGIEETVDRVNAEFGTLPDDVETTMYDVDDVMVTTGDMIAESAAEAGADSTADFVAAATANMKDIETAGRDVGIKYIQGILRGLEAMASTLINKVVALAAKMNSAFEAKLEIKSPSKVGEKAGKNYPLGVAKGIDEGTGAAVDSVVDMADMIVDASRLIDIPYAGANYGGSTVYNNQRSVNVNATYQSQVAGNSTPGLEYLDFTRQIKRAFV